ncbi:MAG: hypothetical protein ABIT05_00160 [Chitinophagaceae bacterium]
MKKNLLVILAALLFNVSHGQTFLEKNGTLSSDVTDKDIDFNRNLDVTVPEAGTYMIMLSAQGGTQAQGGDPFKCFQRDGIVKVWSRTRNFEILRTPINYIFADQNSQSVGNPPGLKQLSFPYYNIMVLPLTKGEVLCLKGFVSKTCPSNAVLGKWNIFDARLKIIKL